MCFCCVPTSQSLSTLTVIEDFLSKRPMPTGIASSDTKSQTWVRNLNYYSEWSNLCSPSLPQSRKSGKKCGHHRRNVQSDGLKWFIITGCNFSSFPIWTFSSWQFYTVLWSTSLGAIYLQFDKDVWNCFFICILYIYPPETVTDVIDASRQVVL